MKSIEIKASLPFSWCRFCNRMDLETQKWMADGRVEEIENVCANAAVCEACERARAADLRPADEGELVNPYMEEYYGQWYHCSVCGAEGLGPDDKFCPNCGAGMRKAAAQKKSEDGQDDAAEEGESLESLKLGAAFDAVEVVRCGDCAVKQRSRERRRKK